MAQVTLPTYDAGYMVANRIESVLVTPGASIYGQLILATAVCMKTAMIWRTVKLDHFTEMSIKI